MDHYDIAIIGAGPSGSACALALHQSGLNVVVIDQSKFPRDKVCGDAIPGPSFKAMHHINPDWEKEMRLFADHEKISTSKVISSRGKTMSVNWESFSYNSKRIDFDQFLYTLVIDRTSTNFISKRIKSVDVQKPKAICNFQDDSAISASLVIGCDGAYSIVKRSLTPSTTNANTSQAVAVRSYYKGVTGIEPGVNEFHFFREHAGYFWIFPLGNDLSNIGFGISSNEQESKVKLRETMQQIVDHASRIAPRFANASVLNNIKGFALPIWNGKTAISGDHFMLCGDAASLIDPLQGHGIDKAMWSGLLAAEQAIRSFASENFSAKGLSDYDQAVHHKIGSELNRSLLITKAIIRFPWLLDSAAWFGQRQGLIQWVARKLKI